MSGSIPTFFGGLTEGLESGYDTISAGQYRKSIEKMRDLQAKAMQQAGAKQQGDTNASVLGTLMAPGGRLAPGQDLPTGTNAAAYVRSLPADQVEAARLNAMKQGFTPAQWSAFINDTAPAQPVADGSTQDPDPFNYAAQPAAGALPLQQAKGGAIPGYATGGSTNDGQANLNAYIQQYFNNQGTYSPYGQQPDPSKAPTDNQQAKGGAVPGYAFGGGTGGGMGGMFGSLLGSGAGKGMGGGLGSGSSSYLNELGKTAESVGQSIGNTYGGSSQPSSGGGAQPSAPPPAQGAGAVQNFNPPGALARGGAIPTGRYAGGGPIDKDVGAAIQQSNGQPQAFPASAPSYQATGPAQPMQGGIPMPANGALPQGAPTPAPQYTSTGPATPLNQPQAAGIPGIAAAQAAPVPQGGMQPLHPPGLTAPPGITKPQPISSHVLAPMTPAAAAQVHGAVALGLHPAQRGQINPTQAAANYTEGQHGVGAINNQTAQTLRMKVNGPGSQNDPLGIQNASMLNNLYNYDLEHYGPQAAAADSFAVLQNYRINMQMYGGAAISAFQNGDMQGAAHYLEHAYAFFPDGNDVKVTAGPNNSLVATRYDMNGKVLDTSNFTSPNSLMNFVTLSSNFEQYTNQLDAEQKAQLIQAQTTEANAGAAKNSAEAGLAGTEAADDAAKTPAQIAQANAAANYDNARTAAAGKGKPPTAQTYASYQGAVSNALVGTNGAATGLGDAISFNNAPPAKQAQLLQIATRLGVTNTLDPATAAQLAAYAMTHPDAYDAKAGTISAGDQQFQVDKLTGQLLGSGKATGGTVTPAARAMAAMPSG